MRGMVYVPGPFVLVLFGSDLFKSCVLQGSNRVWLPTVVSQPITPY